MYFLHNFAFSSDPSILAINNVLDGKENGPLEEHRQMICGDNAIPLVLKDKDENLFKRMEIAYDNRVEVPNVNIENTNEHLQDTLDLGVNVENINKDSPDIFDLPTQLVNNSKLATDDTLKEELPDDKEQVIEKDLCACSPATVTSFKSEHNCLIHYNTDHEDTLEVLTKEILVEEGGI